MSRGASPRSPPPSSLADAMPILDRSPPTRASSGLPSSLLRFVSHDSPASVKRALEGTTRRSWEAVRTALGLRDASPPPCLFASARSSPRCSTASCDASREEEDASSAHGHSGWFSEGFHSSRALANLLSARLDSVESDVAEAKRHLASLERWRRRVDASAELTSESGDSEDAAFASQAEDSGARTRSARSSSSSREAFSEALASEPSASRLSLVALVAAQTAAKRYENENAHVSSPSDSNLANLETRHRARGARLLHPSPPESPEEARSSDEYDFERRDFERRVGTRGAASAESVDESIDESIDPLELFDDRGSGLSRLIEDVREVRAEVARLKNAPFFAGEDARQKSRVTGSSPY